MQDIATAVQKPEFSAHGLVKGATDVLNSLVHENPKPYDKFGVLQEAVALVNESPESVQASLAILKERLTALCQELRRVISSSQQAARRITGKQAIQRLIDEFFITHKEASSVFDIQILFERIQQDTELLGVDGENLDASLKRLLGELKKSRASGQRRFVADTWRNWRLVIEAIRKNPLGVSVRIADGIPVVVAPAESDGSPEVQVPAGNGKPVTASPEAEVPVSAK